jgi:hypothetical protein
LLKPEFLFLLPPSNADKKWYTESGLKLLERDLASLATQGVGALAQVRGGLSPNAYTGYGISKYTDRLNRSNI